MKKRMMALVIAGIMCMSMAMTACGSGNQNPGTSTNGTAVSTEASSDITGMANPVEEVKADEMVQKTGIELKAPEGATDVVYSVINMQDGTKIAQMDYTLDGYHLCERAMTTQMVSLDGQLSGPKSNAAPKMEDMEKSNISGLCYKWARGGTQMVNNRDAFAQWSKEGPCYIAWLDVVPGVLYNLSCDKELDSTQLVAYAEQVFIPMQDEC